MLNFHQCRTKIGLVRRGLTTILSILVLLVVTAQIPMAVAEETYEERMARLDREREQQQNLDVYMEQWRKDRNAVRFHAIAYSKSTFKWGYAWGKDTQARAEQEAMRNSGEADAKVLCWSKGNWYCALADGPDSFGGGSGETPAKAKAEALRIGKENGGSCRIVLLVGGSPPTVELSK